MLGLRSTRSRHTTTGVSAGPTPNCRSSSSAPGSFSRSTNRCGSRLRMANRRSRRVSSEYREPTMRKPAPSPMTSVRLIRYARRITSPSIGSSATRVRSRSTGTASTSPGSSTTVLKYAACRVSTLISPRNRRGPCTRTMRSSAVPCPSTTATLPASTTKNSVLGSPSASSTWPGRTGRRCPYLASVSICSSVSRGKAPNMSGVSRCARSDEGLVDIAPAPVLAGLERLHDGVPVGVRVPAGVPVRRGVAAANVPAGQAQPQVYPPRPRAQALLAAVRRAGHHWLDQPQVRVQDGTHLLASALAPLLGPGGPAMLTRCRLAVLISKSPRNPGAWGDSCPPTAVVEAVDHQRRADGQQPDVLGQADALLGGAHAALPAHAGGAQVQAEQPDGEPGERQPGDAGRHRGHQQRAADRDLGGGQGPGEHLRVDLAQERVRAAGELVHALGRRLVRGPLGQPRVEDEGTGGQSQRYLPRVSGQVHDAPPDVVSRVDGRVRASASSTQARSTCSGAAPGWRASTSPSYITIRVGTARTSKRCEIAGASSTLTLTSFSSPARSVAIRSSAGLTARHGPHHGAHRSTSTAGAAFSATSVKSRSPASTIHGSGPWQLPHRGRPSAAAGTRFCFPHRGQVTVTVLFMPSPWRSVRCARLPGRGRAGRR